MSTKITSQNITDDKVANNRERLFQLFKNRPMCDEEALVATQIEEGLRTIKGVTWVSSQNLVNEWVFNVVVERSDLGWDALARLREVTEIPGVSPPRLGVQPKDPPDTRRDAQHRPPPADGFLVFIRVDEIAALPSLRDVLLEGADDVP